MLVSGTCVLFFFFFPTNHITYRSTLLKRVVSYVQIVEAVGSGIHALLLPCTLLLGLTLPLLHQ
jgi:hypothetical protein